jgi:ribonuclease P protein component
MKSEERLNKPAQYSLVYEEGATQVDRFLVLKVKPNRLEYTRFGISVSKKVGKAVVRNRVKRVLREVLRLTAKHPGWDIVVIARSPSAQSEYRILERSATNLLLRARVISN